MEFREFVHYHESLNSPSVINWDHELIDNGKPKKATFEVKGWWYWISFTGPNEYSVNPLNLGNLNGKQEYLYSTQFDAFRGSEGDPIKNSLIDKFKMITKSSADSSFDFTSTKLGDEKRVFSSVMQAIKEFLNTVKPAVLTWRGRSSKLAKIYQIVANRFASGGGYSLIPSPYGGNRLVRKDVVEAILERERQPIKQTEPGLVSRLTNKVALNDPVLAAQGWPYRHGDIKSLT